LKVLETERSVCAEQSTIFPLYDKLTAENIVPSLMNLFKELQKDIDELEASAPATWADLVDPYERLNDRLNLPWGIVTHLEVRK
jgi:oligopeptidase A